MRKRKSFALILSAVMMMSCVSVSASAESETAVSDDGIAIVSDYSKKETSELSISLGKATCTSICKGESAVVNISVVQTLQKHRNFWTWDNVSGASWTSTSSSKTLDVTNFKSDLESGTYRLKSVFTLTTSDGDTETITKYSEEQKVS